MTRNRSSFSQDVGSENAQQVQREEKPSIEQRLDTIEATLKAHQIGSVGCAIEPGPAAAATYADDPVSLGE